MAALHLLAQMLTGRKMRQLCSTVSCRTLRNGKNISSDPPLIRRGILYIDDCEALFCDKLRAKCMEDFKKELAEKCRRFTQVREVNISLANIGFLPSEIVNQLAKSGTA